MPPPAGDVPCSRATNRDSCALLGGFLHFRLNENHACNHRQRTCNRRACHGERSRGSCHPSGHAECSSCFSARFAAKSASENARSCPCRRPCPYLYRLCLSLFLSALASIPAAPTVLLHSVLIVAKVFDRVEAFGKLIAISETVHNHWLPRKD